MAKHFEDVSLVHVVRQYTPMIGGLEDFVRQLVAHQKGRFASLKVVTLDRLFIQPDKKLPAKEAIDGVEVHRIPFRGSSRYPLAPAVFSHVKGADLVHVHAVDFFFDALALSKPFHRRNLVATTHGGFFHTETFQGLKKLWLNGVTRLSATQYSGIACCSDNDLSLFRSIAKSNVRLIENGVNLSKFQGASSVAPRKRLVTVGRFSANKRLERLLDTMLCLCRHDKDWQLEVIGGPSDLSVQDIEDLIAERGLQEQVSLHIKVPDQAVRDVMSRCSLFVSASEYEGFGIAMIEGLSAGLLPVAEPNQAFQGLAKKHPMVRLASFAEPVNAAQNIMQALSELEKKPDLRNKAITSAAQHSWETTIRQYDTLYEDALRRKA
ncbi:Mannosylfructose-phosphate synthase [Roseibium album]|nr:Mannosylfructose-phosphate synthase [Roseibium album]